MPKKRRLTLDEFRRREVPVLADIVGFSNNIDVSLYSNSTVVKSPEVVFRGLLTSKNRLLSEEYLLNFQRCDADFGRAVGVGNYSLPRVSGALARRDQIDRHHELINLPPYDTLRSRLGPVIRSRRSVRAYSGTFMPLVSLATILFHAQGLTGKKDGPPTNLASSPGTLALSLRATPSGGALFPISMYLLVFRVTGLEPGAYKFIPEHYALRPISLSKETLNLVASHHFGEITVRDANFVIVYAYQLLDNSRKYGDSGLSYAFLEAGQIAQNVHLACTAIGLGSCDVGGFAKHKLESLLGLDGLSQHAIHLSVVGYPSRKAL